MIAVPLPPRWELPPWPRAGGADFFFSVRSAGGATSGNGVHEFDWTMEVDGRRGMVTLESFRSDSDAPGEPIGVFRQALPDGELREFLELARGANLGGPAPAMTEHPGYTSSQYLLDDGGRKSTVVVNNSDRVRGETLSGLRRRMVALFVSVLRYPERSVRLDLALARAGGGEFFALTVANHGTEKVCFGDPRSLGDGGRMSRGVVRMAEYGGSGPLVLNWRHLPLTPPGPRDAPLVTLAPGAIWKAMAPLPGRTAGTGYLAEFSWANYGGPAFEGDSYRLRGRMASPRLMIDGGAA